MTTIFGFWFWLVNLVSATIKQANFVVFLRHLLRIDH